MAATWMALYNWVAGIDPRISGIFIGFFLSQGATFLRDWLTDRKQAQAVRRMLELEIDHNLRMLEVLAGRLTDYATEEASKKLDHVPLSLATAGFHRKAFESQIPLLHKALTENEIAKVYRFYARLSVLDSMVAIAKARETTGKSTPTLIEQFRRSFLGVDSGNPLSKTKPDKTEPTEKPSGTS